MNGQNLKSMVRTHGIREVTSRLSESLKKGFVKPEHFSLRELAESFMGHEWVKRLNPNNMARYGNVPVMEAGEGIDVSAFSNITGQLIFTEIEQGWKRATRVSEALFRTIPTEFENEKFPWLGHIKELGEGIHPGQPYPEMSFGERYIQSNNTLKKGGIVSITKEMIFFDRTGQVMQRANDVGEQIGYQKEYLCLRMLLGIDNSYNLNGTAYNTFSSSGNQLGTSGWVNLNTSTPLVDYTSINQAMILFSQMLDPDSLIPIQVDPTALFVMPANVFNAKRIVSATETRNIYPGYSASNPAVPGNVEMIAPSPVPSLEVHSSNIAYQLAVGPGGYSSSAANSIWLIGDFKRGLAYRQNWPLVTQAAPAGSIKEFEQDIVVRIKASEMGAPMVLDPRQLILMHN